MYYFALLESLKKKKKSRYEMDKRFQVIAKNVKLNFLIRIFFFFFNSYVFEKVLFHVFDLFLHHHPRILSSIVYPYNCITAVS